MPCTRGALSFFGSLHAMQTRSDATLAVVAWLESRGATVHPSLELFGARDGVERGVFALKPIGEGELLLRLPRTISLAPLLYSHSS